MSDPLNDTLTSLRTDADRVPLADSDTVRRRGNQRTRRQAIGSSLAVVALIAGVAGVSGALTGSNKADAPPADEPTLSTTMSPEPTAAASEDTVQSLADEPYLEAGDLRDIGPFSLQPNGELPSQLQLQCMDVVKLGQDAERSGMRFFDPDLDATMNENLFEFEDQAAAEGFVLSVSDTFSGCDKGDPSEVTTADRGPEDVGNRGVRASRLSTPTADAGIGYYELGVIREANVVVVLEWSSMGNPLKTGWIWDADRLGTARDRALG